MIHHQTVNTPPQYLSPPPLYKTGK